MRELGRSREIRRELAEEEAHSKELRVLQEIVDKKKTYSADLMKELVCLEGAGSLGAHDLLILAKLMTRMKELKEKEEEEEKRKVEEARRQRNLPRSLKGYLGWSGELREGSELGGGKSSQPQPAASTTPTQDPLTEEEERQKLIDDATKALPAVTTSKTVEQLKQEIAEARREQAEALAVVEWATAQLKKPPRR